MNEWVADVLLFLTSVLLAHQALSKVLETDIFTIYRAKVVNKFLLLIPFSRDRNDMTLSDKKKK